MLDTRAILEDLRALATERPRAVVVTHDNPDPDSMASGAGLVFLLQSLGDINARLVFGGIIGRAENQEVARLIKPSPIPLSRVAFRPTDLVALMDTQPEHGNHSLPPEVTVDVVVDHHPARESSAGVAVPILSAAHGATSSIVTELIRAAGLEPPTELATALFYGVKTDTRSLSRESDAADRAVWDWLYPRRDPAMLARVEHPRVPGRWFEAFHRAFERARVYGDVVIADIGDVYVPDIVPEVAERLMSLEGARWAVATGVWEGQLYLSFRSQDGRVNAGKRIQRAIEGLPGSAGGHGKMAAGAISLQSLPYLEATRMMGEVIERVRAELGAADAAPVPLIDHVAALEDARAQGTDPDAATSA